MATLKREATPGLPEADLMLAVYGPWDPRAICEAQPTPLWHPRVSAVRLRALWRDHRAAIETAADAAGMEPWIVGRLGFADLLDL